MRNIIFPHKSLKTKAVQKFGLTIFFIIVFLIGNSFSLLKSQEYQHLIIYGQSLSTGHQSWPSLSTTNVPSNFMIGNQVWTNFGNEGYTSLYPLVANVAATTKNLAKTRANNIYGENPLVAAANHIQLKTKGKYKYIASSCGTGGLTIEQLSKEYYKPNFYKDFTNTIDYGRSISSSIICPAIFWMQGEYNYAPTSKSVGLSVGSKPTPDKNTYKSLLIKLKSNMQNDIINTYNQPCKPIFISYQTGAQYSRGKELAIGMAQLEAANENSDVICAGPIYPMTDRGGHLDSNGYRWYGEILGKVYYRTKILNQKFIPLQPKEISRNIDAKGVKIKFHVPKLPLVFDESLVPANKDYGFEIFNNNVKIAIKKISIKKDCVIISTQDSLMGSIEAVYAGTNNKGNGNLRDSDKELAYYNYIDLDKKNSDGTYFFERDSTEFTLRPSYEPKYKKQAVIYNKSYPLYNFSVAFYYKLDENSQSVNVFDNYPL